eukprot:2385436-Pleurochrysis_carterae.AAC.7
MMCGEMHVPRCGRKGSLAIGRAGGHREQLMDTDDSLCPLNVRYAPKRDSVARTGRALQGILRSFKMF